VTLTRCSLAQPAQPERQAEQPAPEQATAPPKQDALTLMAAQLEEMRAEFKRTTATLAEAIVKINEKVEAKAAAGGSGGGDAITQVLAKVMEGDKTSLEAFAKQAEGFARAADALERFRHPSRIGVGEALLMRAGVRAIYPRYMTKAEIAKAERVLGVWEAFEEGETEHVSE